MTPDFQKLKTEERRLRILEAVSQDPNETLSQRIIKAHLDIWALRVPIEVVRQDLRHLAAVGAIKITEVGDEMIAELCELGHQHLAREIVVEGVMKPRRTS